MRINFEDDERVEVQMAPLIDCVFLLLIFFLVATSLKKIEKVIELDPPVSDVAVSKQVSDDTRIISIDSQNTVYWGGEPIGDQALTDRLKELAQESPEAPVLISTDRETHMQAFTNVLGLCKFMGIKDVEYKTKLTEDHGNPERRPAYNP
jgi:biopolymer transport protein ExbD